MNFNLSSIPTDDLIALKHAINQEIRFRKQQSFVEKRLNRLSQMNLSEYKYDDAKRVIEQANSEMLLSLPTGVRKNRPSSRIKYLPYLLAQNWDYLFQTSDNTNNNCYVYAHLNPESRVVHLEALNTILKGQPFYIGKGSGSRAYDLKRNQGHGKLIKQIRDKGFPDSSIVQIVAQSLTEREALVLEAKLIYFFGSIYDETTQGWLVNLADHIHPKFVGEMKKMPTHKQCLQTEIEDVLS